MAFTLLKTTPFVINDEFNITRAEVARLAFIANAFRVCSLGGSRSIGLAGTGAQDAIDYQDIELDGDLLSGYTIRARIEAKTDAAGTTITPRIWDATTGVAHVTGQAIAALAWTQQTLTFALPNPSVRRYRLQFVKSNALAQCWGIGYLELKSPL